MRVHVARMCVHDHRNTQMVGGADNAIRQIKGKIIDFHLGDNSAHPKFNTNSNRLGRLDGLLCDGKTLHR